ncbi:hypothetical protein GMB86_05665 [Terrilactibacillus sp. BCM23-1]|uniref:Transcription factor zinc-finger domain-containing protein n=1 Tax=Terrilactibacillus tamarindi TaxID=2599694 RepID=A0A6N8CPH5_9BACI|nr:hypothetical protein [Terrilactibacillus tamarindi]
MYCPICDDVRMKEVNKNHVLVDVCPNCKGVWLDRGELDKLLKQVSDVEGSYVDNQRYDDYEYNSKPYKNYRDDDDDDDDDDDRHYSKSYKHGHDYKKNPRRKKKKSVMDMLGDMFD